MKKQNTEIKRKSSWKQVSFGLVSLISFVLFFYRSDVAIEYMKKGLGLCSSTVVPSLFPFMIISELIIKNPAVYKIGQAMKTPMKLLFDVSEAGACAYILGALCGFPIGARAAISAYDNGDISKDELSRLLCFCNNPGSAFVISAIGISLFGSKRLGVLLYACIILSSVIVGVFVNLLSKKGNAKISDAPPVTVNDGNAITVFTSAVSKSALSMLTVCAYVVFFSAMVGCIGDILFSLSAPDTLSTLIFGFFEMTSGVSAAADTQGIEQAAILCAAFSAWSGVSVHCQIITICAGRGLSYKKYFLAKAAQSFICSLFVGIAIKFLFPNVLPTSEEVFMQNGVGIATLNPIFACLLFFFVSLSGILVGRKVNLQKGFSNTNKKVKKNKNIF